MSATWGYSDARRAACVGAFGDWHSDDLWKHNDDLRRYDQIIRDTQPDVIIETGTNTGASASWMVSGMPGRRTVYTIDTEPNRFNRSSDYGIVRMEGDSADSDTFEHIRDALKYWPGQPRVMVSLDSDHSAAHVRQEIELYAPLVTPGCYLVVEDGIFSWLRDDQWRAHGCMRADGIKLYDGTPLDAIDQWLKSYLGDVDAFPFERDEQIEFAYPVTMNPAGWWRRG